MEIFKISDVSENQDIIGFIGANGGFDVADKNALKDYTFTEFSLEELGLPNHKTILDAVLKIKNLVGLRGWKVNGKESKNHYGFSLTYNPFFQDKDTSIYHQTWGSNQLTQVFGRDRGLGNHTQIRNTYYDSYGFREILPEVNNHLGFLLENFSCSLIRSRAAFYNMYNRNPDPKMGWHKDEPPYQLFRMLIPLQTSKEYIIEIKGEDEFGNRENLSKHLETGKVFFWNTRIPHRMATNQFCTTPQDRIHLVLGFSPWFDYDKQTDSYKKSSLYGIPINEIIQNKMFIKKM